MTHAHYIDVLYHKIRQRHTVQHNIENNLRRVKTRYGSIRLLDTGDKHKPVLVIAPDGPNIIEDFHPLIDAIRGDYRVLCFDMLGFGFSYPNFKYDYSLNASVNALKEVLDTLSIPLATLSFSCANSYTAMAFAKQYPQRVERLILSQVPSLAAMHQWVQGIPRSLQMPYIGQLINIAALKKMTLAWYQMSLPRKSPIKQQFIHNATHGIKTGSCFCLASFVQAVRHATVEDVSHVNVPIKMIWGNADHSHRKTDFNSFHQLAPDSELHEFHACGHFPYLEDIEGFIKILK